jgi:hypothetical protein
MSPVTWNASWDPALDGLRKLKSMWPTRGWSWDQRFRTCVSSFFTTHLEAARAAVQAAFPVEHTTATLPGAAPELRAVVQKTGGLRGGQRVLSNGPTEGLLTFGLWWPWGDGGTVSLRVGTAGVEPAEPLQQMLQQLFDVTLE